MQLTNKNKKVYVFLIIGGILMIVINVFLISLEGGSFSNYMGGLAGLAFAISGFYSLKKKTQDNL